MSRIQVLDQITIDKIAAGEVIERPVSIVKELVENSIDADATSITVEIEGGGISLIRISDNGKGISREEVPKAFLRHSTSKIRKVEDLHTIGTLGFRGEALSSVAAVAKVELITKTKEEESGTKYQIEGGKELSTLDIGAPSGSTFIIRQLFYNVPARKSFLKTPKTEAGHIQELLMRLALSHPEISFDFINNNQEKLRTYGNGELKDVIYALYGREITNHLLSVDYQKDGLKITGFVGKPEINRGNRNYETFFVNGRYIKSSMISKSIEDAYKSYMMQHKFPFVVLNFTLDGNKVDVNVHPTKMELRFQNHNQIFQIIYECIHQTLLEPELIPKIQFSEDLTGTKVKLPNVDSNPTPTLPSSNLGEYQGKQESSSLLSPGISSDIGEIQGSPFLLRPRNPATANPASTKSSSFATDSSLIPNKLREGKSDYGESTIDLPPKPGDEDSLDSKHGNGEYSSNTKPHVGKDTSDIQLGKEGYISNKKLDGDEKSIVSQHSKEDYFLSKMRDRVHEYHNMQGVPHSLFDTELLEGGLKPTHQLIGQIFNTYWLVSFDESLYIIDQHAAHEKVLYERVLEDIKTREHTSQQITPPMVLNLTMLESNLLKEHLDSFTRIGFEIEEFGGESYTVRAVPANLFSIAQKDLFIELLDTLSTDITTKMTTDIIDKKIASMACKGAVKGRQQLSQEEVSQLIEDLLTLENPYFCPHGRPTIISFTRKELEKKFKRIV